MRRILCLFTALLLSSCINVREKVLQVDYVENDELKHIFLNVIQYDEDCYKVVSQEYTDSAATFVIVNIFDYNR